MDIPTTHTKGEAKFFINTELGPISRLVAGTPPAIADRLKSVLGADNVMTHADMAARNGYTRQIAVNSKEIQ